MIFIPEIGWIQNFTIGNFKICRQNFAELREILYFSGLLTIDTKCHSQCFGSALVYADPDPGF
jgi:hypothetical protein